MGEGVDRNGNGNGSGGSGGYGLVGVRVLGGIGPLVEGLASVNLALVPAVHLAGSVVVDAIVDTDERSRSHT